MTVYCYDTEFLEDGNTIELISIGIVCGDGREYYAVNADMPVDRIVEHKWLKENVWPHLPIQWNGDHPTVYLDTKSALVKPKWVIANEVRDFLVGDVKPMGKRDGVPFYASEELPELWAYFGAYDHVALAQLWGTMMQFPDLIPMWTHELMQLIESLPKFEKPVQDGDEHNALADARWNYKLLCAAGAAQRAALVS